ncbi:MAG: LLM class flavin-dependent oxidoreductase, partial [Myxococcota bacterium]
LGKPLKSILHGRADIPIYTGSIAPKGLALCGELCDGVLLTCMNPERSEVITEHVEAGMDRASAPKSLSTFDIAVSASVVIGDDLDACRRPLKAHLALYMGGMGARAKNFHNEYIARLGFEEAAKTVQELYLSGKKKAAIAAVPDALIDALHLVGPRERIRDRLAAWRESPVTTLLVAANDIEAIRLIAELNS